MPAVNFQPRFADAVKAGEKRQTIRKLRKDGRDAKPGDRLYLFTGMRRPNCEKLGEAVCTAVYPFAIMLIPRADGKFRVATTGIPGFLTLEEFAKADGFSDADDLIRWFLDTHGLPFYGIVIQWDKVVFD